MKNGPRSLFAEWQRVFRVNSHHLTRMSIYIGPASCGNYASVYKFFPLVIHLGED